MDTKLTLKLEHTIIEKAKDYARTRNTSLSRIVESYLKRITTEEDHSDTITPLVKSLSGVLDLPAAFDEKKAYSDYLVSKYE
jgi:macrodomain Ter protein organizer (MatP/YcbG family)